ncbi:hypothetical protein [Dyadobacter sp. BHUBP1]|uniref:hypothetical protein n=1 Tax=Dyadobacter sp. BHUBP1 TaxID=3424178 RepID=UPI003D349E15
MTLQKTLAGLSILLVVVALSCTDHSNPGGPEQPDCLRINGTPRLYPCEFEIVQIDVMRGSSNTDVYAALTPGNHNVHLLTTTAFSYDRTGTTTATLVYKIRLHVKRIARPAFATPAGYWISESVAGGEPDDPSVLWPNRYYPAPQLNMAIGETSLVFSRLTYSTLDGLLQGQPTMVSIQNPVTYQTLADPPYNYALVRDRSEAYYLPINATYSDDR